MSEHSTEIALTDAEYQAILATVEAAAQDAGATVMIRGAMWSPIFRGVEQIIAARLAPVEALAEKWNSTPDYTRTEYDRGRVDQRHDMTTELLEVLSTPPRRGNDR